MPIKFFWCEHFNAMTEQASPKISVGISSCLLGEKVRFDGGHKHLRLCTESLSRYFDFVPVCPEVEMGLGIPRKPIHLAGDMTQPRVVETGDDGRDLTEKLQTFSQQRVQELPPIAGYILMKKSPSCGLYRVKVHQQEGHPAQYNGRGLFAQALTEHYPQLPVEESGRLSDPALRENFMTRVFAYADWQQLVKQGLTHQRLIDFHARYKYSLMAHSPARYAELGRMLADAGHYQPQEIGERYFVALMDLLGTLASRKTHTNVLMHLQGYLKKKISHREKQELAGIIEQYRTAQIPLVVPVTLLRHHFNNHPDPYINRQAYLKPYPDDLSLRNAI